MHLETRDGQDSYLSVDCCPAADKQLEELWRRDGAYVIIETHSGHWYTNQTHGKACRRSLTEGLLVELPAINLPHVGCGGGLTIEESAAVTALLAPYRLQVDCSRIHSKDERRWGEAWIPVRGRLYGILTYPNCD